MRLRKQHTHTCSLYGCGSNFVFQIVGCTVYIYILYISTHNTKNTACLKILKIKMTHNNKLYKSGHYVTRTYQDHLRPCLDLLIAHFLQLLIDHPRRVSGGGPRQELTGLQALLLAYRRLVFNGMPRESHWYVILLPKQCIYRSYRELAKTSVSVY